MIEFYQFTYFNSLRTPISGMRLGIPDDSLKANNTSAHKAYNLITDNFGAGYNGQIVMLVNTKDGGSKRIFNKT